MRLAPQPGSLVDQRVYRVDRPHLKIPKSFVELQALNTLLKKYRDIYPYRIVVCYVTTYLLWVHLFLL